MPNPTPLHRCLAILLLAAALPGHAVAAASEPVMQTLQLAGLASPAQILVDQWGVPHMYAASRDDAFFVQGFNAARDRLFQIDLWRRRGLGRLSAVFGADFIEQDKATRQFLYRGDMPKEWAAYGKDSEKIARRFTEGINAYIDLLASAPERMPFEFRHFGYLPEKWAPEDVVRIRSHGLVRNVSAEVSRAQVACKAGLDADRIRFALTPPWETKLPDGLDPCLPEDVLRVYTLATQNVTLAKAPNGEGGPRIAALRPRDDEPEGSNAWVIAPSRTATGRPILANDPHRTYATPSLRYLAHISAPGLDVIGAGEPSLPGISIGHNGTIAFGLTIFSADQEDLMVYELNPVDPYLYRYQGTWEAMQRLPEKIEVRDGPAVEVRLPYTRHGPVIYIDTARNRAYAIRTTWNAPGMAPYFGSIHYMMAKTFSDFRAGMQQWGAPVENQVFADVKGNIGWAPGGHVPQRPNWDGLLPVPGDGRYEWRPAMDGKLWPNSLNPKAGYFATANELNLPAGYPYRERKLGFEWPNDDRYKRLVEFLSKPGKQTVEDSMRLQTDTTSLTARRLLAVLKGLQPNDVRNKAAMQMLARWDGVEGADSAAAALYEVWFSRYLSFFFRENVLEKPASSAIPTVDTKVLLRGLEKPETVFGQNAEAKRNWVMLASLSYAWADCEKLMGSDPRHWQWGKLHHSLTLHPFSGAVDAALRSKLDVGPLPRSGGGSTPNVSAYDPVSFRATAGASVRIVVDVGQWDNSRAMNTPGQSGDPDNPHYRDLAPMWARGEYFPLLYSRAAVEAAARLRIDLVPKP